MGENRHSGYRRLRNALIKWYLILFAVGFALVYLLFALSDITGLRLLQDIGVFVTLIPAVQLVFLIPFLIWMVTLTGKARAEVRAQVQENEKRKAPEKTVTDSVGDTAPVYTDRRRFPSIRYRQRKEPTPWWCVILLLFMLPPLGAFFLFQKLYQEPEHYLENAITVRATGLVLLGVSAALALLILTMGIDDPAVMWKVLVILPGGLCVFSGAALWAAGYIAKKARSIAACQRLIWIDAEVNLDKIAVNLGKSYGETVQLLQSYIDEGYLFSCYIDFRSREVVSPEQLPKVASRCRYCGGTTVHIRGLTGICGYCGRILR